MAIILLFIVLAVGAVLAVIAAWSPRESEGMDTVTVGCAAVLFGTLVFLSLSVWRWLHSGHWPSYSIGRAVTRLVDLGVLPRAIRSWHAGGFLGRLNTAYAGSDVMWTLITVPLFMFVLYLLIARRRAHRRRVRRSQRRR